MTRAARVALPVLICLGAAAPFLPALAGEFLNWDDSINFVANPHYRGLGWSQIKWMFTTTLMGHYIPITWLSFGLNYVLGGMNPWGYHLGNVLLHAANATLVYLIARRLLAAAWNGRSPEFSAAGWPLGVASGFAALAWGVHPLRVESVAWITERRDVLGGLFFLLTILAYLRGLDPDRGRRPLWRGLSMLAYATALLAKASAMPLPVVLLLLDWYPLRRRESWRRLLVEKTPYAILAAGAAAGALIALPRGTQVTSYEAYGAVARVGMVAYSILFYPIKLVLPMRLSPMYELPARVELTGWPFLPAILAVSVITLVLVLGRARWPGGLAAWLYSMLMVLPTSGVVHAGSQLVNDRYSYLSSIGFAVLAGGGLLGILRLIALGRLSAPTRAVFGAGAVMILLVLGLGARAQTQVWHDSETLWRWAVEVDPACAFCHGNLGSVITSGELGRARLDEAERHLRRAIELRSDQPIPYFNLGTLMTVRGRYEDAEGALRRYRELVPGSTDGLARLGLLHVLQGRYEEALPLLERARGRPGGLARTHAPVLQAIGLVEDDLGALILLGRSLVEQGRPGEAADALRRALALAPSSVPARFWLARAYRDSGRDDLAQQELAALRGLDPGAAAAAAVR